MFSDRVYEADGFDSTWKDEKASSNQSIQTTDFQTKDQHTLTTKSSTIQTQTDDSRSDIIESVDMNKLASWLKDVCPAVMNELKDTSLSNAMASMKIEEENTSISAHMIQQFAIPTETKNLSVSSLSWNSTGNTLAIACSHPHTTWCHHQGVVYLFTFDRNDELSTTPTKKFNCESCVMTVCFHPVQPSTLCAGTFSGEIYLWNNQNDDGDCLIAMIVEHDDQVSLISWVLNMDSKNGSSTLASASRDEYICLWEANVEENILKIKNRYTTGRVLKSVTSPEVYSRKSEGGIVDFDFSPFVPGLFVLGMEGGSIIKCSTLGAKPLLGDEDVNIFDPSINNFENHEGDILSIKFSPHRKELFLTCGSDNEIKIFHIDQITPTQIIFMDLELQSVSWIIHEPKLVVGCGMKGAIRLYSLLNGQLIPSAIANNAKNYTRLAINKKRTDVIAFGNVEGIVELWSIPWNTIANQDYSNIYGNK